MLAAALFAASSPALSQSTGTTFSAPLTNGSTRAARTNGGLHTTEGWRVTSDAAGNAIGQYLMYVMPAGAKAGTVEFEARGFATGKYAATSDNREHMWGVCDKDVPHDMPESASSCFQLRLYDHKTPTGTFYAGAHRFRFMSPATSDIDADKKSPVSWDRNKWYRFKFQWSQTGAQWYKDGVLQGTLRIPSQNKSYRYVYVGSDYRKVGLVPVNVTYRNVRITSNVAGTWNVR